MDMQEWEQGRIKLEAEGSRILLWREQLEAQFEEWRVRYRAHLKRRGEVEEYGR